MGSNRDPTNDDPSGGRRTVVRRRAILASSATLTTALAGCSGDTSSSDGDDGTTADGADDDADRPTTTAAPFSLADHRSPRVALGTWGTNGVGPGTTDIFEREVEAAVGRINEALGSDLTYVGQVSLPPSDMGAVVGDATDGATQDDLLRTAAEGLALQVDGNDAVESGMHVVVPHNVGGTGDYSAPTVPIAWKLGDSTVTERVDGDCYFLTTLGSTFLMDEKPVTMGREMEAWQAVGRLLGASPLDGGYSVAERDGRRVIVDVSPMATRHTFGRHGGRDAARRPYDQPRLNAANVAYDERRGESVYESTGEPVDTPNFVSDRRSAVPADAEHVYGKPENNDAIHRWGRYETDSGEYRVPMRENHVKAYTATALESIRRTLRGDPAQFDAGRPARVDTRCGPRCESVTGRIEETFEDGAIRGADNSEGLSWRVEDPTGSAEVVERESPGGGSHALRMTNSRGYRERLLVSAKQTFAGWDCPWTLGGRVYTRALPSDVEYTGWRIYARPPDARGFRVQFRFLDDGAAFIVADYDQRREGYPPNWDEETWYDYEIAHDGAGNYAGRVWETDAERPGEPQFTTRGEPITEPMRIQMELQGTDGELFSLDHAGLFWSV